MKKNELLKILKKYGFQETEHPSGVIAPSYLDYMFSEKCQKIETICALYNIKYNIYELNKTFNMADYVCYRLYYDWES
jgi:hypothetical protein